MLSALYGQRARTEPSFDLSRDEEQSHHPERSEGSLQFAFIWKTASPNQIILVEFVRFRFAWRFFLASR